MMSCGFARALLVLLLFLATASVAESYICRYNCSNVNNIYCKTKNMVCPYPNGDDLAMERANMLLAKSTKKKCTRAMKLFICHLWFPTCEKSGAVGNVNPVCWQECMNGYQNCDYSYEQAMQKCMTFTYTQQVAPEDYALPCLSAAGTTGAAAAVVVAALLFHVFS